jgi:hypothetical protein
MNIFVSSFNAKESAQNLDDKRLIKMVLETAQILSTNINLQDSAKVPTAPRTKIIPPLFGVEPLTTTISGFVATSFISATNTSVDSIKSINANNIRSSSTTAQPIWPIQKKA